jgi:hypothetical protein
VVNAWQQRKEAQEAKAKATAAALESVPPNNLSPKTAPGKPSNGVSHPLADHNDGSKAASKKKPSELTNDGATSQGKDRKRANIEKGKDESELLSWQYFQDYISVGQSSYKTQGTPVSDNFTGTGVMILFS